MHEEIDLSKEGNGHYQISIDMSQALEMMKSMGGSEKIPDSVANKKIDTAIALNYMIDSSELNLERRFTLIDLKGSLLLS